MISISSIYDDVALDNVNSAENGNLSFQMFNRLSKRAELRMLDFLSGDIENQKPPAPYTTQKLKDILSPFITKYPVQISGGIITRPDNYYNFDSMELLTSFKQASCEEEEVVDGDCDSTSIQLLGNSQFDQRCNSYIEGLTPSFSKPISRMVGRTFEFLPKDLGSIVLQYLRYPVYGKIFVKMDDVYNQEIIDEAISINYEYDEFARELLVDFISRQFFIHTRERAGLEQTQVYGKLVRDAK